MLDPLGDHAEVTRYGSRIVDATKPGIVRAGIVHGLKPTGRPPVTVARSTRVYVPTHDYSAVVDVHSTGEGGAGHINLSDSAARVPDVPVGASRRAVEPPDDHTGVIDPV